MDLVDPGKNQTFIGNSELIPSGKSAALMYRAFRFLLTGKSLLLLPIPESMADNTRGDYWILTKTAKNLPTGKGLPTASLMFAKFSPRRKEGSLCI